ncbi:MAG: Ig-like domain-containing protein, partial [Gemmatimonadota bacterium]
MTLTWNPSADSNVTGYRIYYGVASRTYTNIVDVGGATSVTISNLVEGVTYYFAATAYNVLGMESDYSGEISYTVPSAAVNQAPTLNTLGNVTLNEGAGLQTVNLSGISSGASNEVQTLTVSAASSNPGLIPNPAVTYTSPNATGTLSFTPVALANGVATITVMVNDGGASNNVVTRTFTVTVNGVNQAPTLNALGNVTLNEGAGLQTVNLSGISSGASNEVQTLTVSAASSNPGLIPNPAVSYTSPAATGTLSFTPVALANGVATITVMVN